MPTPWIRFGPYKLVDPVRNFAVHKFAKVRMRGDFLVRAAAATLDGRAYFVPRWKDLDDRQVGWVAEKRSASSKAEIEKNFAAVKPHIKRGIGEFFGAFPGETFFIVGSGPSLVKNVGLLHRRPGTKIIAVNGALKALPPGTADFYFTLDWLGSRSWLDGVDTKGVKLVASVTIPPPVLTRFDEVFHFVGMTQSENSERGINQEYSWLGQLDGCLTGTYSAMHFAWRCGAKRIVLVGQDFACRWGMYHWDEALDISVALDREFRVVPDLDGGITLTDYQLERNADCVKAAMMWCCEDGVEVLNATEGGILDMNRVRLADVYEKIEKEEGDSHGRTGVQRSTCNLPA